MNLIKGSLDNPVARLMITLGVVILGVISFTNLAIDLFPDITYPIAGVVTEYRGATSEDIETAVTRSLEKSVSRIQGVQNVSSFSRDGISLVRLEFNWGTNLDAAAIDLQQQVGAMANDLPDDSDRPIVIKFDPSTIPVVTLGLQGSMDERKLRELAEDYIAPRLEAVAGVADADVSGGRVREIQIQVDRGRLEAAGLSLSDVVRAVQRANVDRPGGSIKTGTRDISVRTFGRSHDVEHLGDIVVRSQQGRPIRVRDLAQVADAFEDPVSIALVNGSPGLFLPVRKQPGSNTVQVADGVLKEMERLRRDLPPETQLFVVSDQSTYIRRSIQNLKHEAYVGAILAALVVFVFLGNLTTTAIICLSIPISIITTFVLLYFGGMTLNIMTLGGLALGVGRLVDDSIVVLENIYRHMEQGEAPYEAAYRGTVEVSRPVIAATVTTAIVFLPIAFVHGVASILFSQMAFTVAFALLASLFESLTLVPILCHWFMRPRSEPYKIRAVQGPLDAFARGFRRIEEKYAAFLSWAFSHKAKVLLGTLGVFALSCLLIFRIDTELFPPSDEGEFGINVRLPVGTRVEESLKVVQEIQDIVMDEVPELRSVFGRAGSGRGRSSLFAGRFSGSHSGTVRVRLVPHAERTRSSFEIMEALRPKVTHFPGARITMSPGGLITRIVSFGAEEPIDIEIQGYDMKVAMAKAAEVSGLLGGVEGVTDVQVSREEGMPEYRVQMDHQRIAAMGLTPEDVAGTIRTAVDGTDASVHIDPQTGKEHKIRVRFRESDRQDTEQLNRVFLKVNGGRAIPLNNLATFRPTFAPTQIERKYQQRIVHVTANVTGRALGSVAGEVEGLLKGVEVPKDFNIRLGGAREEQERAFRNLTLALALAVFLVYMVLASQYGSLLHPFVIMFSVPLGLIGVVWALYGSGTTLSIISFIGVIMMTGIVVSNAIILIEYINQLREAGTELHEAVMRAGKIRLRPIIMTSLTTILALLPLALGIGEGAEANAPLAVTVIGGLTVSTFLTLVFVPTLYTLLEEWRGRGKAKIIYV